MMESRLNCPNQLVNVASMTFTRSFRKVVLRNDVANLGFAGEICFVKPGRALNDLVPNGNAYFFTDPRAQPFLSTVSETLLRQK